MLIRFARIGLFSLLIAATAGSVRAQTAADADNGIWFSYRDLYQVMIRFEKFGKPKQFIQSRLQIVPKDKSVVVDGIRMTLAGKSTHVNLPVDAAGLAVFPLLKAAYDENAELQINRPSDSVKLEPVTTIVPRADGIYDTGDLRTACDQALQYLRYISGVSFHTRQCVGVKFSFSKEIGDIVVKLRDANQHEQKLAVTEGGLFDNDGVNNFKVVMYRFPANTDKGQIVVNTTPLAITAQFE